MAEHERTHEIGDDEFEELRRFARSVQERAAGGEPVTVDVDDATMDELRRFAAGVRTGTTAAPTTPAPTTPAPPVRRTPPRAPARDDPSASLPTRDLPPVRPPAPEPPPTVDDPLAGVTRPRLPDGIAAEIEAGRDRPRRRWEPPQRTAMPVQEPHREPVHHGPWRAIALALAAVVVVLAGLLFAGRLGDSDAPSDDSTPPGGSVTLSSTTLPPGGGLGG